MLSSESATEGAYPAYVQGDWMEAADESIGDADLGLLVRSALAASRSGVPFPDFSKGPAPERSKLLKLAGVRSETQYAMGTRSVSVAWEESEPEIKLIPCRNGGRREGFIEMPEHIIGIDPKADNATAGSAIRRALSVATAGA